MALGEFLFKIRGDSTQFGASIGNATGKLNQFGGAVQSIFTRYVLPYFGARAMMNYAKGTMQWAGHIDDLARRTGLGVEQIQELEHAARMGGSSIEAFANAVRFMGLAQSQAASGSKAFIDMFERWGMSDWKTLSPGEAMYKAMARMKGQTDITAQTFRDLQSMFGRSATELIPAMTDGLDKFAAEARNAGIVIEESIVQNLVRAGDEWDTLMARTKAAGVKPMAFVARGLHSAGALGASIFDIFKTGAGFMSGDELKKRHRERFDKVAMTWGMMPATIGQLIAAAFVPSTLLKGKGAASGLDFANLAKASSGGGLSAETDQWGRMGLYATSGQQIYQRSVLLAIRQIQKDIAAVKNNTADTAQTMDERF